MKFDWKTRKRRDASLDLIRMMKMNEAVEDSVFAKAHNMSVIEARDLFDTVCDVVAVFKQQSNEDEYALTSEIAMLNKTMVMQDHKILELERTLRGIANKTQKYN